MPGLAQAAVGIPGRWWALPLLTGGRLLVAAAASRRRRYRPTKKEGKTREEARKNRRSSRAEITCDCEGRRQRCGGGKWVPFFSGTDPRLPPPSATITPSPSPTSPPLASNLLLRLFTSQSGEGGDGASKPFIAFVLGKIVPSEITVELIRKAMESNDAKRVLIDGFPRCEENRIAFERITGTEPDLVIFFDCPEDEMVKRLLGRNQGRVDDNIETIKKRLKVFESLNIPVVDYYTSRGKVHKINATGTEEEIFGAVHKLFSSLRF
uniref:adenylate kinase n=1 Tax=Oryza meridionalis TaxID=40149 RepID=A0A0E0D9X5_9ORYZ